MPLTTLLNFSSPSATLIFYNLTLILPTTYILTLLTRTVNSSQPPILRFVFVLLNWASVVGFAFVLNSKALRIEAEIACWHGEIERLEGLLRDADDDALKKQFEREAQRASAPQGNGRKAGSTASQSSKLRCA